MEMAVMVREKRRLMVRLQRNLQRNLLRNLQRKKRQRNNTLLVNINPLI